MTKTRFHVLSGLIVLATLLVTFAVYTSLPAQIPTHWNAQGVADGYGPRSFLYLHTAFMIGLVALWTALPWLSPARFKIEPFQATYWFIGLLIVVMIGYVQAVTIVGVLTSSIDMGRAVLGGVLVFIALIGNVLGKVRRNFWIGIRTPWTLADDRVWYATHRFAAKTMVLGAVLGLAVVIVGLDSKFAVGLLMAGVLIPVVYSLVYSKRLERSNLNEN